MPSVVSLAMAEAVVLSSTAAHFAGAAAGSGVFPFWRCTSGAAVSLHEFRRAELAKALEEAKSAHAAAHARALNSALAELPAEGPWAGLRLPAVFRVGAAAVVPAARAARALDREAEAARAAKARAEARAKGVRDDVVWSSPGGLQGGARAEALGKLASEDPAALLHHRMDFIEKRELPSKTDGTAGRPKYMYKHRTCVVCKSKNARHYCTGCGPKFTVCGNTSKKDCYAQHVRNATSLTLGAKVTAAAAAAADGVEGGGARLAATAAAGAPLPPAAATLNSMPPSPPPFPERLQLFSGVEKEGGEEKEGAVERHCDVSLQQFRWLSGCGHAVAGSDGCFGLRNLVVILGNGARFGTARPSSSGGVSDGIGVEDAARMAGWTGEHRWSK